MDFSELIAALSDPAAYPYSVGTRWRSIKPTSRLSSSRVPSHTRSRSRSAWASSITEHWTGDAISASGNSP